MGLTRVAVAALATVRVVETVKEIIPLIPPPPAKSLFACAVGAGVVYIAGERDLRTVAASGVAAAGLAAVIHDLQHTAVTIADNNITEVLTRVPRRAMSLPTDARPRPAGPLGS